MEHILKRTRNGKGKYINETKQEIYANDITNIINEIPGWSKR